MPTSKHVFGRTDEERSICEETVNRRGGQR